MTSLYYKKKLETVSNKVTILEAATKPIITAVNPLEYHKR